MAAVRRKSDLLAADLWVPCEFVLHIGEAVLHDVLVGGVEALLLVLVLNFQLVISLLSRRLALHRIYLLFCSITSDAHDVLGGVGLGIEHADHGLVDPALEGGLLKVLLHFLSEHGFESFKNFILVVFLEHVGELCNLFALLAAGKHLVSVDAKLNDLGWLATRGGRLGLQLDAAEFVVALFALAVDLVAEDLGDWELLAAHVAGDLVLVIDFKDDFGGCAHQAV